MGAKTTSLLRGRDHIGLMKFMNSRNSSGTPFCAPQGAHCSHIREPPFNFGLSRRILTIYIFIFLLTFSLYWTTSFGLEVILPPQWGTPPLACDGRRHGAVCLRYRSTVSY